MGIDPGIGNTGYVIVQRLPSRYDLLHSGVIHAPTCSVLGERLDMHYKVIRELLTEHSPNLVCIESVYFNRNITSCLSTASVIATCELASVLSGISALQIKPQNAKRAVTGKGTASKQQVKKMVNRLLRCNITSDHTTDAAAIAIAGLLKQRNHEK